VATLMPRAEPTVYERLAPPDAAVADSLRGAADECFWLADAPLPQRPRLTADHGADLCVVGGGYTGLWTAVRAKQRDPARRVVLLEGGRLGWAASGRNGGFCAASLTHGEENGRTRWPDEYDVLERLGRENLAGIRDTVRRYDMDVDLEHTGELDVAVEAHQVEWLRQSASRGRRFLDREEVSAEVASPIFLAGCVSDDTLLLHPAKLVRELARVAADLGVELVEHTTVTGLSSDRHGVDVVTGGGTVRADHVALGTNAFPALVHRYRAFTVPVYDYAVVTEPLTAEQRDAVGWRNRQGLADPANHFHYFRLTPDDRILYGGYDAVYHFGKRLDSAYEHRPQTHALLVSHLLTTFPQLEGIRVSHRWAGAVDTSTRFSVFFGLAHRGRVAHAAGFTGLGVGATRFAADVLLDLLAGEQTERTALGMVRRKPVPFPPEPLASAGIHATRWSLARADHRQGSRNLWLRSLDRLGLGFDS
jgi:glycine/D-amino acid oxidase-like deaminating enzyme